MSTSSTSLPADTLGRPLRDLRISVTDRCNFRCTYCMPAEVYGESYQFLPKSEILSFEEIERLARIFVSLGVKKLRLTGGEPLIRAKLPLLIRNLRAIPGVDDLAMTTNGLLLAEHAEALAAAHLDRITISLDSIDPDTFNRMSGRSHGPGMVLDAIAAAERAGFEQIKINCVVQKGVNDHTIVDLARHFHGSRHIVRFIEFMDVGTLNGWELTQVTQASEILDRINAELPIEPVQPGYKGEVARRWRYRDGGGEIGVIASVSQPFCGDCSRARLSTDGSLVTCLFARAGHDLREQLRSGASDAEIAQRIADIWQLRTDRYSQERSADTQIPERPASGDRIEMFKIGG